MRVPVPIVLAGGAAVLVAGGVALFMLIAAIRMMFAFAEMIGAILLVVVVAYIVWKVFFQATPADKRGDM